MRRSAALILSLIVPSAAVGAQAAPAYTTPPPPPPPPPAMPADEAQPVDPEIGTLRDTVARQSAVIAKQKTLIAALNGRLAAQKRKCQ